MGIGMVVIVAAEDADGIAKQLHAAGEGVSTIGSIENGLEPVLMV
jgi:phosphoribosylaminoimidazole (AIR) synthetase